MTRTGKIARLPQDVREQLNLKLQNNEMGEAILDWLNVLPEVRNVLEAQFEGKPINHQNLSKWRRGGWREWRAQQEAFDKIMGMASDANELKQLAAEPLTDNLTPWLVASYYVAVKAAMAASTGDLKLLHEFCADMVALRRGDHSAARLKLELERLRGSADSSSSAFAANFSLPGQNAGTASPLGTEPENSHSSIGETELPLVNPIQTHSTLFNPIQPNKVG